MDYVACSKPLIISSVHPIASLKLPCISSIDGDTLSSEGYFWKKKKIIIFGNIYDILSQEGMLQIQHLQGSLSRAQDVVRTPHCKISGVFLGQSLSQTRSKMLCTDWVQQERAGKCLLALHFRWSLSAATKRLLWKGCWYANTWCWHARHVEVAPWVIPIFFMKHVCKPVNHDEMTAASHRIYYKHIAA